MKKSSVIVLVLLLLGTALLMGGCQTSGQVQTAYRLEPDEITSMLEQVGLPGEISEEETASYREGHISYVIRDPAETYGDSGNNKVVANVASLAHEDGRALATIFVQNVAGEPIVWADWERQIKLAALLYGGFEDEESLYKACIETELPTDTNFFRWEAELSEGYCCVSYGTHRSKTYDERGFEVVNYSATMWVSIYESREFYEQLYPDDQS